MSNCECFRILFKRTLNISDYEIEKFAKCFEYVLTQEPVESLVRKLLVKIEVDDVLDMISKKLYRLKENRDKIKDSTNQPVLEQIIRTIDLLANEGNVLYIQESLNKEITIISDKVSMLIDWLVSLSIK